MCFLHMCNNMIRMWWNVAKRRIEMDGKIIVHVRKFQFCRCIECPWLIIRIQRRTWVIDGCSSSLRKVIYLLDQEKTWLFLKCVPSCGQWIRLAAVMTVNYDVRQEAKALVAERSTGTREVFEQKPNSQFDKPSREPAPAMYVHAQLCGRSVL